MEKRRFSLDEVEIRVKFDLARSKYVVIYGESIFEKCQICKGKGLVTDSTVFSYAWDSSSYCSDCDGYGGMFILGEVIFECDKCKGEHRHEKIHCEKCKGSGFVDWIENVIGKPTKFRLPSSADDDFAKSQSFYSSRTTGTAYKALKVPWSGV